MTAIIFFYPQIKGQFKVKLKLVFKFKFEMDHPLVIGCSMSAMLTSTLQLILNVLLHFELSVEWLSHSAIPWHE